MISEKKEYMCERKMMLAALVECYHVMVNTVITIIF